MLHHWELGQDLSVEHLDHALVNLSPAVPDARDVEQDGRVLPERALLDVVDEADGGEVHVGLTVVVYDLRLGDVGWSRGAAHGALDGGRVQGVDGAGELCGAENVGDEGVVVETPNTMGASGFKVVS